LGVICRPENSKIREKGKLNPAMRPVQGKTGGLGGCKGGKKKKKGGRGSIGVGGNLVQPDVRTGKKDKNVSKRGPSSIKNSDQGE